MEEQVYEVVSALGEPDPAAREIPFAPSLDTLEGKTICELYNDSFRGEITFPIIEEMLRERYPDVKVIPYSEFPLATVKGMLPAKKAEMLEDLRVALEEKGCDAVITGNGA